MTSIGPQTLSQDLTTSAGKFVLAQKCTDLLIQQQPFLSLGGSGFTFVMSRFQTRIQGEARTFFNEYGPRYSAILSATESFVALWQALSDDDLESMRAVGSDAAARENFGAIFQEVSKQAAAIGAELVTLQQDLRALNLKLNDDNAFYHDALDAEAKDLPGELSRDQQEIDELNQKIYSNGSDGNGTTTQAIGSANKQQSAQALVVQTFSNSVLEQPDVDLSGFAELQTYETEINTGLNGARDHAHHYLNDIQPALIGNISNIGSYYQLHQAIPTAVSPGSSKTDWLDVLHALKDQAADYEASAAGVLTMLTTLHDTLSDELRQVQAGAQGISAQAEDVFTHAKTILDNQNAYQQQLNDENHAMQSSFDQQQSRASDLQGELDQAEFMKQTASFLTFGLSDLVAKISGLQDDLDQAEQAMHEMQMVLMYQSMIIQGTTTLLGHTSKVVDILSGIRNTVTMVTADLDHLFAAHPDLDKAVVLRLFVAQATSEMQSLISDAS